MSDKSNIIGRLRLAAGLTQAALAERLGGKWDQSRISNLEREHKGPPRSKTVLFIAKGCRQEVKLTADGWEIVS